MRFFLLPDSKLGIPCYFPFIPIRDRFGIAVWIFLSGPTFRRTYYRFSSETAEHRKCITLWTLNFMLLRIFEALHFWFWISVTYPRVFQQNWKFKLEKISQKRIKEKLFRNDIYSWLQLTLLSIMQHIWTKTQTYSIIYLISYLFDRFSIFF